MATAISDQRRKKEAMEVLVLELSRGDEDNIVHSLRTAIDRGWLQSFADVLKEAKKKKDTEIDRICSRHYIDFLTSVKELLLMRGSAQELRSLVTDVHSKFHVTGGDLVSTLDALQGIQSEREQSRHLLESSLLCKEIAKMMMQVNQDILQDVHYRAMRTIEWIQMEVKRCKDQSTASNHHTNSHTNHHNIHHNHLTTNTAYSSMLSSHSNASLPQSMLTFVDQWLPVAINKLLYSVRLESDTLLTTLRQHTNIIGQSILFRQVMIITGNLEDTKSSMINHVLNHVAQSSSSLTSFASSHSNPLQLLQQCEQFVSSFIPPKFTISLKHVLTQISLFQILPSMLSTSSSMSIASYRSLLTYLPLTSFQVFLSYHFSMTLSPQEIAMGNEILDYRMTDIASLNKVLHLYAVLGKLSNYHQYYQNIRIETLQGIWKQLEIAMSSFGVLKACHQFFEALLGFFTIEFMIAKLIEIPHHTFSNAALQQLWYESMAFFQSQLMNMAITLTSENDLIQLKEECILLLHILSDEMYKLDIAPIVSLIKTLWDIFDALQMQSLSLLIHESLAKVAYQPYTVTNNEDLQLKIRIYSLDSYDIDQANVNTPQGGGAAGGGGSSSYSPHPHSSNNGNQKMDSKLLDRHLDALEEEIITTSSSQQNNSSSMMNNPSASRGFGGGSMTASMSGGGKSSTDVHFVSQTFAFSEFIPMFLKDVHARIIKLFIFSIIKLPNQHNINNAKTPGMPVPSSSMNNHVTLKESECSKDGYDLTWYGLVCHSVFHMFETMTKMLTMELKRDGPETALSKVCQIFIDSSLLGLTVDTFIQMVEHALLHFCSYDFYQYLPESVTAASGRGGRTGQKRSTTHETQSQLQDKIHHQIQKLHTDVLIQIRLVNSNAQDLIFELLSHKIQDLLESLVFINFVPDSAPPGVNVHAVHLNHNNTAFIHDTVESIMEFLSITFMLLTHLPLYLREAIYFTSCKQLANGILSHVLSAQVTGINIFGLLALDADCKRLFNFADSCGVESLRQCFIELQELIQCALSPDLQALVDNPQARKRMFPHVDVQKLSVLIDKILPSPLIAQSGNLPRFEKAPTKMMVKKLRALASQY